jgi:hypothetical protein
MEGDSPFNNKEGNMANKYTFKVTMTNTEGMEIASHVPAAWSNFLNGHWVKTPPTRPGRYLIAHKSGRVSGEAFVYESEGKLVVSHRESALHPLVGSWLGWWWSAPMPPVMPLKPPVWVEEDPTQVASASALNTPAAVPEAKAGKCHLKLVPLHG